MKTEIPTYSFVVQWSKEDDAYVADVRELPGVSGVAESADLAVREAQEGAAGVVELMHDHGRELPSPELLPEYSGQFRVRMPRSLHKRLAIMAAHEQVSLNLLTVQLLSEALGRRRLAPMDQEPSANGEPLFAYERSNVSKQSTPRSRRKRKGRP